MIAILESVFESILGLTSRWLSCTLSEVGHELGGLYIYMYTYTYVYKYIYIEFPSSSNSHVQIDLIFLK
jgi:hypothetical protein